MNQLKAVNSKASLLAIIILFSFVFSGCGFQLNRNRGQLPDQARKIAISLIRNNTQTPGLDLSLKEELQRVFSSNPTIQVTEVGDADLILSSEIQSLEVNKSLFTLTDEQHYEFRFQSKGTFSLVNDQSQKKYYSNAAISGIYPYTTTDEDLSLRELREGRVKSVQNLAQKIYQKLIQNF